MTRDLDLIRAVLADLEARPTYVPVFAHQIELEGRSTEEIAYHCELLSDQGFIVGDGSLSSSGPTFLVRRMTAQGHDYLDAVRNDTVWAKVKATMKDRGVAAPLDLVQRLALQYIEVRLLGPG